MNSKPPSHSRLAIATLGLAGVLSAPALLFAPPGSAATSHAVKITLKETAISFTPGPDPNGPPRHALEAGIVSGSLGPGADRTDVRVLDGKGTRDLFVRKGSIHGRFAFSGTRKGNGDTIVGTFTVTGGTGRYAHAHGKLHIAGFHSDDTNVSTERIAGKLSY
jgi:hypothetical protein